MKKIILIFLLINTIGLLNAQGNLQFNSALYKSFTYYDPSTTNLGVENILTFNIPPGKVWKITECLSSRVDDATSSFAPNTPNTYGGKWSIKKNGTDEFHILTITDGSYSPVEKNIWLGEGTYFLSLNRNPSSSYKFNLLLSGTEYNIIP